MEHNATVMFPPDETFPSPQVIGESHDLDHRVQVLVDPMPRLHRRRTESLCPLLQIHMETAFLVCSSHSAWETLAVATGSLVLREVLSSNAQPQVLLLLGELVGTEAAGF